ncbi:MAG: alpha/beta hydrolase [Rhizobiaceae bacterium]|nr:alpha/beta hydrolase [Rhizobiaceae bacterium]
MKARLRYFVYFLLALIALVVGLSLYQPPMRLMPAPTVFLNERNPFSINPNLSEDPEIKVFYATNRLPIGPRANRIYAIVPGRDVHLGLATVRIGQEGTTWDNIYALSTGAGDDTRPFLHLENLNEQANIESDGKLDAEARAWFAEIETALQNSLDKDITVYVHGANTTMERAAGQAAQLHHFTGRNSVVVMFAWPTAENFLRYSRDMETAFGAAPHLAKLIELLAGNTTARNIDVLTYSAGGTVGSDALGRIGDDVTLHGSQNPRIGEVYHAAPDADFRSFVNDMQKYAAIARRMTVAVNMNDAALRLSQLVNRASRAGRPDLTELSPEASSWLLEAQEQYGLEVVQVRPENIPGMSRWSHTFWYEDPWVSTDVLATLLFHLSPSDRGLEEEDARPKGRYWTFAADHLKRLTEAMARR